MCPPARPPARLAAPAPALWRLRRAAAGCCVVAACYCTPLAILSDDCCMQVACFQPHRRWHHLASDEGGPAPSGLPTPPRRPAPVTLPGICGGMAGRHPTAGGHQVQQTAAGELHTWPLRLGLGCRAAGRRGGMKAGGGRPDAARLLLVRASVHLVSPHAPALPMPCTVNPLQLLQWDTAAGSLRSVPLPAAPPRQHAPLETIWGSCGIHTVAVNPAGEYSSLLCCWAAVQQCCRHGLHRSSFHAIDLPWVHATTLPVLRNSLHCPYQCFHPARPTR